MIILYFPICIGIYIGYSVLIALIFPLMTAIRRPEYPFHSLSLVAALIKLIPFVNDELLIDSSISKPFKQFISFTSNWNYHSMRISEKIHQCKSRVTEFIFFNFIKLVDLLILFPIYFLFI